MKKIHLSLLTIFIGLILVSVASGKKPDYNVDVVMIGIGAKNPAFDESQYPDLKIFYTPEISVAKLGKKKFAGPKYGEGTGSPELLTNWWNYFRDGQGFHGYSVLLDKNGVGAWEGIIKTGQRTTGIFGSMGDAHNKKKVVLKGLMKPICKKGKTAKFKAKRKTNPEKKGKLALNGKFPEFSVTTADGATVSSSSLQVDGKPTLVVFFHMPADTELNTMTEENAMGTIEKKAAGKKSKFGAMAAMAGSMMDASKAAGPSKLFSAIESHVFGN